MVEAGNDIIICQGKSGMLNGNVSGNYDDYEWVPPTGLSDPFDLNPTVTVNTPTIYTLRATGTGSNVVANGGFEAGAIAPATTAFNFVPPNSFAGAAGGSYTIGTSATFGNIFGCAAYGGNFAMAYNGSSSGGASIWCQTVTVTPNTDYKFEMFFMAVNIPFVTTPPSISIEINGQAIGGGAGGATCAWNPITGSWNSGGAGSATICINNSNGSGTNIGVIDDISLIECCVVEDQVMVDVVDIMAVAQPAGPITCDNPTLILNGAGSSVGAGYSYEWITTDGRIVSGGNTLNPTIDRPGTYTLTVTGPGNCEEEVTIMVEGSVTPPMVSTFTDVLTCDDPNGLVGARSPRPNVDFEWTGPNGFTSFDPSFFTMVPGKYYVRVEDQYNCWTIDSVEVLDQRALPEIEILGDTISCGKDSIDLIGLSPSWRLGYSWLGPNMMMGDSQILRTGDTGRYILTVVDSNDCVSMDTFFVIETDLPFNAFAEADTIDCNRPFATLRGFSDSSNVSFSWTGPNGFNELGNEVTTSDSGTYVLTVNFQGCIAMDTVEVVKLDGLPEWDLQGDTITCLQDSAVLIGTSTSPGAVLSWTGPGGFNSMDDQVTVGQGGIYRLEVVGANGCTIIDSFEVLIDTMRPAIFTVEANKDTLNCLDTLAELTVMGSLVQVQFEWQGPNGPIMNNAPRLQVNAPGIYSVNAVGTNGCARTNTIEIFENRQTPLADLEVDTINCIQEQVQIKVNGNPSLTAIWSGPGGYSSNNLEPSVDMPGLYTVALTGANGCDTTMSIRVETDTVRPVFSLQEDTLDCSQPTVNLTIQTNDSGMYNWRGPNGFSSNQSMPQVMDSGWYILTMTSDNGCFTTDSVNIKRTEATPDISALGDTITCDKDSAIIVGSSNSPGVDFEWTGPKGYQSGDPSNVVYEGGSYTFKVLNMSGCSSEVTIDVVLDTMPPTIIELSSDGLKCDSNSTVIRSDLGVDVFSFEWNGPLGFQSFERNPRVFGVGWYVLTASGENGCLSSDSIFVVAQDVIPDIQAKGDTLTCVQQEANLIGASITDSVTFLWNGPGGFSSMDSTITTNQTGSYTLKVTDKNGCTSTLEVTVEEDYSVSSSDVQSDTIWCDDAPAAVNVTLTPSNTTFSVIDPMGNVDNQSSFSTSLPGTYQIITTHPYTGCLDTQDFELTLNTDTIIGAEIMSVDIGCQDSLGSISITNIMGGRGPFMYSLNGNSQDEASFTGLSAANYSIGVIDRYGCQWETAAQIDEATPFNFMASADVTIQKGQSASLSIITDATVADVRTIEWSPAQGLSCTDCQDPLATPEITTIYTVTMTDINGCTYEDEVVVVVQESGEFYIPNTFSPNGDNLNDVLMIFGNENATINYFCVYDRWGELVFSSENGTPNDPQHGWNGTFESELALPGVYVLTAEVELNGQAVQRKSDVTLVR